ncbi:hypothetical protein QBT27_17935 [Cronobacter sakazakii]|nr:hypothetical protein [Cronobacter sakazakii]
MSDNRFSAQAALATLKDFQRDTVDYVFERLFGENNTTRFLVADEVGLGKTLIARGVIARTLEHLQDKKRSRRYHLYLLQRGDCWSESKKAQSQWL